MLTAGERNQVKQILSQPQWATVERLATVVISQINEQNSIKETQWQTIQAILMKEGEISGIRRFLKEMYNQAQNV